MKQKMLRNTLSMLILALGLSGFGQENRIASVDIRYNKRLNLVGFDTTIVLEGHLKKETVYQRMIYWFKDDFQKLNIVISLKDSIEPYNSEAVISEENYTKYPGSIAQEGNYRIQGRYQDYYQYKKIGTNNGLEICGRIKISITDNNFRFTMTNLNLPGLGFLAFEDEVLNENKTFRRTYRKLEPEMCIKTAQFLNELIYWVENYNSILLETESWKVIEPEEGKKKKKKKAKK